MNRSLLWVLSALVMLAMSCASPQPKTTSRSNIEGPQQDDDTPAQQDTAAKQHADDAAPRPDGPIDLGMGDSNDSNAAPIVISRPNTNADGAPIDIADGADQSKKYDKKCKTVADCKGLEPPDCDGAMQCAKKQCVFVCTPEDSEGSDESEEMDDFEEPGSPQRQDPSAPGQNVDDDGAK